MEEGRFAFCLLALALADKYIYPGAEAFLCWYWNLILQNSDTAQRPPEIASLGVLPFHRETAAFGLAGPHSL